MKKFLLMIAAVGVLFTACNKETECGHDFIEHDYTKELVGTWTVIGPDAGEALEIKADGTLKATSVFDGEFIETTARYEVVNNRMTIAWEDGTIDEGRLDVVKGAFFSMVVDEETGAGYYFRYCHNDLADEIVGMWVCNDGLTDGVTIMTYSNNGKSTITTAAALGTDDPLVKQESDYVVVGDLVFMKLPAANADSQPKYTVARMNYKPNGTSAGDIMIHENYIPSGDGLKESVMSFLRIKQTLNLANQKYDYIKTFVSNVKGEDKDIDFMGYTFNFAKMDGSGLDKMLKALLFAVEFPNANKLSYSYMLNNNIEKYDASIVVEGNKMTIKMSDKVATLKDVVLYAFQDADCSQLHFYMHKTAFVNFYTNMQAMLMEATDEQFDINNAEAVNAIYNEINNAVQTINVSLVMSK